MDGRVPGATTCSSSDCGGRSSTRRFHIGGKLCTHSELLQQLAAKNRPLGSNLPFHEVDEATEDPAPEFGSLIEASEKVCALRSRKSPALAIVRAKLSISI
jgi:hypothetical protein